MGKSLKGKELGVGISQRKDGLYTARFTSKKNGKVIQKYFKSLRECRNWYAEAKFQDVNSSIYAGENMTVDTWFHYWLENIKGDNLRYQSQLDYNRRYHKSIKPFIGSMQLSQIKPLHCQNILINMSNEYSITTIKKTRFLLYTIFESALENDVIVKNPVTKNVKVQFGKDPKSTRVLTAEEQQIFLQAIKGTLYDEPFSFILQTGLRVGELVGLKWSDIDLKNNLIHVQRTMFFKKTEWIEGKPKTKTGERFIPLTIEAAQILQRQKEKNSKCKRINIQYADFIFLTRSGTIPHYSGYDKKIREICMENNLEPFSIHTLRHTFATRCIEAGMKPKTLQKILGHSKINMTMDLYVHVTEEEKIKEMQKIQDALKIV